MSRVAGQRLLLKVQEPVEAELLLVTPSQRRPPTEEELFNLGFFSKEWLYQRMKSMLAAIGGDDEEPPLSRLRYFLDYVCVYRHEVPDEAIQDMREILWPAGDSPESADTSSRSQEEGSDV
jgi:hypothetical protein